MKKHLIGALHKTEGSTECSALEVESRFSYPGMVFVYPEKLDPIRLRHALARVLDDFPQYAGRFIPNGFRLQIEHSAGAVQFETESTQSPLETLIADIRAGRGRRLEPQVSKLKVARGLEAGLVVKLTEARDGCALAVGWNHAVGDMQSTRLLMRAWADAYAGRSYEKPIIITDRDAYLRAVMPNPRAVRSAVRIGNWFKAISIRLALLRPATRVSLDYSWTQLAAIHQALSNVTRVSVNDAVCAHVYTVLRRLAGATEPTNLCLVVNFRKRLGLSDRIVGNMTSLLAQPVDELDTPAQVAAGIRDGLDHYATKHANYQATMRVLDVNTSMFERGRLVSRQFTPGDGDIMITNWNNFGWYDLAFERSKPTLFYPIVLGATALPQWVMVVYELPRSQGLGITVGLPPAVAERCLSPEGQALLQRPPQVYDSHRAHEPMDGARDDAPGLVRA